MFLVVRSSWALFLGIAMMMLGNGLQASLLGLRATAEGFSTGTTGLVMSFYYLGFLAGSTLTPKIVKNVGHVRVFSALASLASTAALIHAAFVEPFTWGAMRFVTGFCYAGLYIVAESWLNDRATNETRGQLLSVYMLMILGGVTVGQLLLNVADPNGFLLFVLASVLVSLALVPVSLTAGPAPAFDAPSKVGLLELYRMSPLGVAGAMATGMAHGVLFAMGAVYADRTGLSVAEISIFMGAAYLGGMIFQWPIGRLSDRFDRRRVMTAVTLLAAIFAVSAVLVSTHSVEALMLVTLLFGGMTLPMYSLCIAHTNDYLEPGQMVAASATLVLVGGLGASLGPPTVAAMMALVGPDGFFVALGMIHAAIGGFALYRMSQRAPVPLDEQNPMVPVPSGALPVAAALSAKTVRDHMDSDLAAMSRSQMGRG
ncbi:MAG: MFS transporter [Rhodospirillales bacterium]|nr:MFS transporter [Rhodospirillales bacterium]MDH3912868.1 MFS transporter [Rhodospirillales bacterium]MDH3917802.1 MFS transporter [Rhodospirillales bacterium]MDH3967368.1 MFS transporter [Rhodospirillales bacterium]